MRNALAILLMVLFACISHAEIYTGGPIAKKCRSICEIIECTEKQLVQAEKAVERCLEDEFGDMRKKAGGASKSEGEHQRKETKEDKHE